MPTTTLEVWVVVDEAGDYAAAGTEDAAAERYAEDIGSEVGALGIRRVKVTLTVPLPTPLEVEAEVATDEGEPTVTAG